MMAAQRADKRSDIDSIVQRSSHLEERRLFLGAIARTVLYHELFLSSAELVHEVIHSQHLHRSLRYSKGG